jgi:hypothetical protein
MSTAEEAKQERDWQALHDAITATLDRFGRKDAFGRGDYWLVDDNWGWWSHQIEVSVGRNKRRAAARIAPRMAQCAALIAPYRLPVWIAGPGLARRAQ